jgi:hypothetical protein
MTAQNPEIDPINPGIAGQNNPGLNPKMRAAPKITNNVHNNRSNHARRGLNVQIVHHARNKNQDRNKLRGLNKSQDLSSHRVPTQNQGQNSRPGPIKILKRTSRLKRVMAMRHHAPAAEDVTVGNRKAGDQRKKIKLVSTNAWCFCSF